MTQRLVGPPPPPPLSGGLIKPSGRQRPVTPSPGVLPVITPQFPTGCQRDPSPDLRGGGDGVKESDVARLHCGK